MKKYLMHSTAQVKRLLLVQPKTWLASLWLIWASKYIILLATKLCLFTHYLWMSGNDEISISWKRQQTEKLLKEEKY